MTSQYGAYALHAGLARLYARMRVHTPTRPGTHMHAQTNISYLLLSHNNGFVNAPQCYVIRTLPGWFMFVLHYPVLNIPWFLILKLSVAYFFSYYLSPN